MVLPPNSLSPGTVNMREFWKRLFFNGFFFACSRSLLVEITERGVLQASVHSPYTHMEWLAVDQYQRTALQAGCPTKQLAARGVCWKTGSVPPLNV